MKYRLLKMYLPVAYLQAREDMGIREPEPVYQVAYAATAGLPELQGIRRFT
jgi:hypothetical protein